MNETKTSDRLAELTMLELLTRINELLAQVRISAENTSEWVAKGGSIEEQVIRVSTFTSLATLYLGKVEELMAEYNSRF